MQKKIVLVGFFSLVCFISGLEAQIKRVISFGLVKSYSHVVTNGSELNGYEYKNGIKIGYFEERPLNGKWSIVSSLNFLNKGVKRNYDTTSVQDKKLLTQRIKTNYIEIAPLTINYKIKGDHGFFLGVGPVLAFGIYGKVATRPYNTLAARDSEPARKVLFNGKKNAALDGSKSFNLKPLEFGAVLCSGYEFKRTKNIIQAAYHQGISNISTDKNGSYRNHYFIILFGFKL